MNTRQSSVPVIMAMRLGLWTMVVIAAHSFEAQGGPVVVRELVALRSSIKFQMRIEMIGRNPAAGADCDAECLRRERHHHFQFAKNFRHAMARTLGGRHRWRDVVVDKIEGSIMPGVTVKFRVLAPESQQRATLVAFASAREKKRMLRVKVGGGKAFTQLHVRTITASASLCAASPCSSS